MQKEQVTHTSGPWAMVWDEHGRDVYGDQGQLHVKVVSGAEADARLIAAAPELLDAAREILGTGYEEVVASALDIPDAELPAFARLRAAIDKATGAE